MVLGNTVTVLTLRGTVRIAWAIARAVRELRALEERLEGVVELHAHRRRGDIADVLEPLIADATA